MNTTGAAKYKPFDIYNKLVLSLPSLENLDYLVSENTIMEKPLPTDPHLKREDFFYFLVLSLLFNSFCNSADSITHSLVFYLY